MNYETVSKYLNKHELMEILSFIDTTLSHDSEEAFHHSIMEMADFLGFEYVLYGHMKASYHRDHPAILVNLSNPVDWMDEYDEEGYLKYDPVRMEMEHYLKRGESCEAFVWDDYERRLSHHERLVIERRKSFGLAHGFSMFRNSARQQSLFLVSFASATTVPGPRELLIGKLIVPHLSRCRKRLDLLLCVDTLTSRERSVANWLLEGKTNWEISLILKVSESTVKFHITNILKKLQVKNRQHAISLLIAERFIL